jgi:phosphatidylglycerophosphate synthase
LLDRHLRPLIDPALDAAARRLEATGVSANAVTVTGFAIGLVAMALIAQGLHLAALACLLLNRIADGLDGAVARRRGVTDLGGFLDIVLDFIVYAGIVFAFALADPAQNALAAAFLIFAYIGTGGSFLAYAVMAAKRRIETRTHGPKSLYYLGGLTEGSETILAYVLFCLLPGRFPLLAVAFAILCWITTASRIAIACRTLR